MFGRKPRLPIDILFRLGSKHEDQDYVTYISKLKDQLKYTYRLASTSQEKSAKANKKRYDRRIRGAVPVVGDRVLFKNIGLKGKHKIANKWQKEIYLIVGQNDPAIPVYQIQKESGNGNVRTVHRNLLLPLGLPLEPEIQEPTVAIEKAPAVQKEPESEVESSDAEIQIEVTRPVRIPQRAPSVSQSESDNDNSRSDGSSESGQSSSESDVESDNSHVASPIRQHDTPPQRPVRNRRRPAWMDSGDYVLYSQHAAVSGHKDLVIEAYLSVLEYNHKLFQTMVNLINSS